ncbi:MAG: bifunctional UDP-N-acetylglucosamine diphosphorylase/glucosamine-1-phosphate N-acetyltransferase GlmU [Pseudomonadota bacterium]
MQVSLIILAAGQGTRMNSDLPKVLHKVAGAPLLVHSMQAGASLQPAQTVIVTGHGAEAVARAARDHNPEVMIALQDRQLGTGHAVAQALPLLADATGRVIVLYGDTPFLMPETLEKLAASAADVTVLGFHNHRNPPRYGRLMMDGDDLVKIVEYKDATADQRAITLMNSGVIACDIAVLRVLVAGLSNDNAAGEYYLTDIVAAARARGLSATAVTCPEAETLGVDTRAGLAEAEAIFQARARAEALENGVTLTDPGSVYFAFDTHVGRDAVIGPHVVFGPGTTVESGAVIEAFCHLTGCHISRGATVGPFARLRAGAELAEDAHVGNFVEIKNSVLGEGVKVGHLTYLGDAEVGDHTNVGAGTVTCNYDGVMKHRTVIGKRAFIGSATMLVAPVTLGDGALTGSGSVITENVPAGAVAIGRARQVIKPGLAPKLFEKLKAIKAEKQKG